MVKADVGDLIVEYLEKNGYHGLYNEFGECACLIKDLGACENISLDCLPGWMSPCDCGEHDFHITNVQHEINGEKNIVGERKEKPMVTMRETIELRSPGCQILVNQQEDCVVMAVETWGEDSRLCGRMELDPEQALRLAAFLVELANKAQDQKEEDKKIDRETEENIFNDNL